MSGLSIRLRRGSVIAVAVTCLLFAVSVAPVIAEDADIQTVEPSATDTMSWAFDPTSVTINAGETVTWINNGSQAHTATASNGAFDTGLIQPGESRTVALAAAGTYEFACVPHPWMKGTVNVIAAAAAPATQPTPPAAAPTAVAKPAAEPAVAKPAVQPVATPTPFRLVTTTTPSPAPRAGSMPLEVALPLLAGGASLAGAGIYFLRRR